MKKDDEKGMAIKWLVTDMDGTLLNSRKEISSRNREAIRRAMQKGIGVTFATGRMHASAEKFARRLGIQLPLISCNGALIKYCDGETVDQTFVDPETVRELIELSLERQWHIQWYIDDQLCLDRYEPGMWIGYENLENIKVREAKGDLDTFSKGVTQLVLLDREARMKKISSEIHERFGDRLFMTTASDYAIDILSKGINKAVGIDCIAKRHGISASEIMVIGDSPNDVDMMQYAGLSVAMRDGYDAAKRAADVITGEADADGFAEAVEKYLLDEN